MLDTQQKSTTSLTAQLGQGADHLSSSSMQSAMPADALTAGPSTDSKSASKDSPPDGGGPRPTNLVFRYNEDMMQQFARGNKAAKSVLNRIRSFEDGSVKDGGSLTDEQKFVMAVESMGTDKKAEAILQAVFFGDIGGGIYDDHVSSIRGGGGSVTVRFWHPGSEIALQSQTFTGAVAYTGKDNNMREKRVQAAKNDYISDRGNRVAYGRDSFVGSQMDSIEFDFVDSQFGAAFKDVPAAERANAAGYNAGLQDFIYDHVLPGRAAKIAYQRRGFMEGWLADNPPPAAGGQAWAVRFANEVMRSIITYDNPEFYAESHNTWRVEDEAAAQILVEALVPGMQVNFDSDAMTIGIVSMPPAKVAAAAPAASTVVAPPPSDLPVVTKNMSALRGHMNTTDKYLAGEGRSKHGLRVGPGCALNQYMDAEGTALWGTLGIDGNTNLAGSLYRIGKSAELVPYKKFLEAWYDWEDAQANNGDAAGTKAVFDAALGNFLAALNDGINGF